MTKQDEEEHNEIRMVVTFSESLIARLTQQDRFQQTRNKDIICHFYLLCIEHTTLLHQETQPRDRRDLLIWLKEAIETSNKSDGSRHVKKH